MVVLVSVVEKVSTSNNKKDTVFCCVPFYYTS